MHKAKKQNDRDPADKSAGNMQSDEWGVEEFDDFHHDGYQESIDQKNCNERGKEPQGESDEIEKRMEKCMGDRKDEPQKNGCRHTAGEYEILTEVLWQKPHEDRGEDEAKENAS